MWTPWIWALGFLGTVAVVVDSLDDTSDVVSNQWGEVYNPVTDTWAVPLNERSWEDYAYAVEPEIIWGSMAVIALLVISSKS